MCLPWDGGWGIWLAKPRARAQSTKNHSGSVVPADSKLLQVPSCTDRDLECKQLLDLVLLGSQGDALASV